MTLHIGCFSGSSMRRSSCINVGSKTLTASVGMRPGSDSSRCSHTHCLCFQQQKQQHDASAVCKEAATAAMLSFQTIQMVAAAAASAAAVAIVTAATLSFSAVKMVAAAAAAAAACDLQ